MSLKTLFTTSLYLNQLFIILMMRTPINMQIRKEPQTVPLYHIQIISLDNISPTDDLIGGIPPQSGGIESKIPKITSEQKLSGTF